VNENANIYIIITNIVFQTFKINTKMVLQYIVIRMEIIICRCGGTKVIFGGFAPPFRTFFQPVSHHQFSTEIAVPHRCAEVPSAHLWLNMLQITKATLRFYTAHKDASDLQ